MACVLALCVLLGCGPEGAREYNEGVEQFKTRDYAAAAASLRKAVERNPEFAEAHHSLGVCLIELDDLDGAARAFARAGELLGAGKAIETDDGRSVAAKRALVHRHLGLIEEHRYTRTMMRDHEAAIRHLELARDQYAKARELDPNEPHSKQRLDQIQSLLSRLEK